MRGKKSLLKVLLIMVLSSLFCVATMAIAPAGEVNASCTGSYKWYFAEGYTGGDFDTWILIQNPTEQDAVANLRFFTPNGEPIEWEVPMAGETRYSLYLNAIPGLEKEEVATEVVCEGDGLIAERAMYFNYDTEQGDRVGGHATIGAPSTSCSWYLPEGYTGGGFDTYILLMNPTDGDAEATLKLMKPQDGKYYAFKTVVPAGRRKTVKLDDLVWRKGEDNIIAGVQPATGEGEEPVEEVKFDSTDVSTMVCSNRGIVAERAMYFDYYGKSGGSSSIGASCAAPEWYLPEGYTGGDFDTWVMAMNPSGNTVDITYTFYTNVSNSEPVSVTHAGVAPWSRDTIHVDDVPGLEGTDVSTKVTATRPVVLASTEGEANRHMVLFGIDDYDGDEVKDAGLEYAVTGDLYDVKHKLVDFGAFSYSLYTNQDATVEKLNDVLGGMEVGPEDTVVFMFSGAATQQADAGTLDEADVQDECLELIDGSVSDDDVAALLDGLGTDRVVAIFNCDYSGGFLEGNTGVYLSNCAENETRVESAELENDAFSRFFAEGIGKAAADTDSNGLVSAEEAFDYAKPLAIAESAAEEPQKLDNFAGNIDLTVDKVPANVVAERSVYFNYDSANDGATSVGACSTYPKWFLAEGYTGGGFDTYILVMNPQDYNQTITATFMTPSGETIEKEYGCPPHYRMTIKVDDQDPSLASTDVSTRISARPMDAAAACTGSGVVVERAMYFVYTDPIDGSVKTGGSSSIGFGSW